MTPDIAKAPVMASMTVIPQNQPHQNVNQKSIQTAHRLGAKEMKNTPARVKLLERP